jgi:hypothetical protein
MNEFKVYCQPYDLAVSHAADTGPDCIVVDVQDSGDIIDDLGKWRDFEFMMERIRSATKLYIVGKYGSGLGQGGTEQEGTNQDSAQWAKDVRKICEVIEEMPGLAELT